MDTLVTVLTAATTAGPTVLLCLVAGAEAWVISLLVKNRKALTSVAANHLSGLPEMTASLARIETLLMEMNGNLIWVKARINGRAY